MTEPTQPHPTTWQPPPAPPSWQPPPAPSAADWRRVAGPLPGGVVAGAVILLVMAGLIGLFAALMFLSASVVTSPIMQDPIFSDPLFRDPAFQGQSPEAMMAMVQASIIAFAAILLVVAIAHLAAGIWILRRRNWARVLGMVLAGIGIVLTGVSAGITLLAAGQPLPPGMEGASGMTAEEYAAMMTGGVIFMVGLSLVVLLAYGFVFFLLLVRGSVFSPPQPG